MLSHQQILHFSTFGYVTLRGLLSPAEAATLRHEVSGALADAFGPGRTTWVASAAITCRSPRTVRRSAWRSSPMTPGHSCRRRSCSAARSCPASASPRALPAIPPGIPARDLTSAA
jgi:hypothetical protein